MCGLVIGFGKMSGQDIGFLRHVQMFNQVRGMHSTGIALSYFGETYETELFKAVGGVESLAKEYPEYVDLESLKVLINYTETKGTHNPKMVTKTYHYPNVYLGHGRYATVGEINEKNAHPFEFDNIVGMHNGTMSDGFLDKLDTYEKGSTTDSYAVLKKLDELDGDEEATTEFLKTMGGEFCFVWYSKKSEELFVVKNYARPLYAATWGKDCLFLSSEDWMMNIAAERSKVRISETKPVPSNHLHKIRFVRDKIVAEEGDFLTFTQYPAVGRWDGYAGYGAWADGWEDYKGWNESGGVIGGEVGTFLDDNRKSYVTKELWEQLTKDGCAMCLSGLPDWDDRSEVTWLDKETPCCSKECRQGAGRLLEMQTGTKPN